MGRHRLVAATARSTTALVVLALLAAVAARAAAADLAARPRIPVILDTDIGDDIDDTWALVLALKSPELDVKLVVTDFGNTEHRAKIVARLLEIAGRTDIPIGIGIRENDAESPQSEWVKDYDLSKLPRARPEGRGSGAHRHRHGLERAGHADRHRPAPEPEGRPRARASHRGQAASGRHVREPPPRLQRKAEAGGRVERAGEPGRGSGAPGSPLGGGDQHAARHVRPRPVCRASGTRACATRRTRCCAALIENYRLWCQRREWCAKDAGVRRRQELDPVRHRGRLPRDLAGSRADGGRSACA